MVADASDTRCVLVFESMHDVMRTEALLKADNISISLIPTPRQVSADCGMAIELWKGDARAAVAMLNDDDNGFLGCYLATEDGYALL